ncbi:MAG: hypothetical protein NTZ15_12565 [Burkholderiales bacterium]|nr:hypothetical protein [Burkholderiales bacterium]
MSRKLDEFGTTVSERLQRFTERVDELQRMNSGMSSTSFGKSLKFHFKFDNGINYVVLTASLVSGVLMLWNPAGWVFLAINAVTALVGVVKAVWGWFDDDFKKDEQRKAVSKNLNQLKDSLTGEFKKASDAAVKGITQKTLQLLTEVDASVEQTKTISSELKHLVVKLQHLSKSIS